MQLSAPTITRTCTEKDVYETVLSLDGAKILELGCGKAEHTRRIAAAHPSTSIIAAEVDRVQHAKNLAADAVPNIRFTDFVAQSIPLADASMDVVMMFRSLHHVPANLMDAALREIARVLRPGGRAYISEPVFAGALNEMIRIFNDEEVVRKAAFDALCRAVDEGVFALAEEVFFLSPVRYENFSAFCEKHFDVTHSERNVSDAQKRQVEALFNTHLGPDGVRLAQHIRIDVLKKPG